MGPGFHYQHEGPVHVQCSTHTKNGVLDTVHALVPHASNKPQVPTGTRYLRCQTLSFAKIVHPVLGAWGF